MKIQNREQLKFPEVKRPETFTSNYEAVTPVTINELVPGDLFADLSDEFFKTLYKVISIDKDNDTITLQVVGKIMD